MFSVREEQLQVLGGQEEVSNRRPHCSRLFVPAWARRRKRVPSPPPPGLGAQESEVTAPRTAIGGAVFQAGSSAAAAAVQAPPGCDVASRS